MPSWWRQPVPAATSGPVVPRSPARAYGTYRPAAGWRSVFRWEERKFHPAHGHEKRSANYYNRGRKASGHILILNTNQHERQILLKLLSHARCQNRFHELYSLHCTSSAKQPVLLAHHSKQLISLAGMQNMERHQIIQSLIQSKRF